MEKQLITDVKDLVQWIESYFRLVPHQANKENQKGVIIKQSIFSDFLCSEYQGQVCVNGKFYWLRAESTDFGTCRIFLDHVFSDDK